LFSHLAPQLFDVGAQLGISSAARTSTGAHDDVHRGQLMLMKTERFAYDTADAIALHGTAGHLRCHSESESRPTLIVHTRSHTEEPIPHAPAARVDRFEVRLPPQAALRGKSESLGMRAAVGQWPSSFRPPLGNERGLSC
jgi:hypothetical protein